MGTDGGGHDLGCRADGTGPLLERDRALADIDGLLDDVRRGDGRCLLIEGAAGIGKTTLLDRAAVRARDLGIDVRRATGDDLEAGHPWGIVRRLFGTAGPPGSTGPAALARTVLDPSFVPEPGGDPGKDFPRLHGLHWFVVELAERAPQLLVLDDMHWSDPPSLRFLNYLLHRLDGLPVGVLVATRPGETVAEETSTLIARIARAPGTQPSQLTELTDPSIAIMVRTELPDATDGFCGALAHATGGNPFMCREMLATVRSESIEANDEGARAVVGLQHNGIHTAILVRLGQLGHDAAAVASAAAVLGPAATVSRVARVAGIGSARAARTIDDLVAAGILTGDNHLGFVHPIIRETIHADLGPGKRATDHRRAATLLHAEGADPAQVAGHLLEAGGEHEPWARTVLEQAASDALRQGSPEAAVPLLEAALAACTQPEGEVELRTKLGRAAVAAGKDGAGEHLSAALAAMEPTFLDPVVAHQLGEALYSTGRYDEAVHAFGVGLDAVELGPDGARPTLEAQLVAGLDMATTLVGVRDERLDDRLAEVGCTPGREHSLADRVLLAMAAGRHAFGVNVPDAQRRCDRVAVLADSSLTGDPLPTEVARVVAEPLAFAMLTSERFDRADAFLGRLLDAYTAQGDALACVSMLTLRGMVRHAAGNLADAVSDCGNAIRMGEDLPGVDSPTECASRWVLAHASLDRGDAAEARRAIAVPDADERWSNSGLYGWYLDALGRVELDRGDPEAALDAFLRAGEQFRTMSRTAGFCSWRRRAALAALAADDRERAIALADEELSVAAHFGAPGAHAEAQRVRARLDHDQAAVSRLEAALSTLACSSSALVRSRVEVDLGAALRRLGRRTDARRHLRNGLEGASQCGARPLGERAASELEAAGARRPRLAVSGVDALTPSERRVVDLAIEGRTNPEIAAALFVSRKTVEVHLSSSYRKLRIASRGELAAALA